jgi:hypothetical protein
MRVAHARLLAVAVAVAFLATAPVRADDAVKPVPVESFEAWLAEFMDCADRRDMDCLKASFAHHWYALPDQHGNPDDRDAFFAFLDGRMQSFTFHDPVEIEALSSGNTYFRKSYAIALDQQNLFYLTVGIWLVDGNAYLFRAAVSDNATDPIDLLEP